MNSIVRMLDSTPAPIARMFRRGSLPAGVLRPLVNRMVPKEQTPVTVRSGPAKGLRLLIYPKAEKYYWSGTHESAVQKAFVRELKPGMVFWDVGAHIGFFSLLASRLVGSSGHVHTFEPMVQNRERLLKAIRLNGVSNITVHDAALAAKAGDQTLFPHQSTTMWTLRPEPGEADDLIVRYQTSYDSVEKLGVPDLIKVDAGGAEVDVLQCGVRLLSVTQPMLIVEFSNHGVLGEAQGFLPGYQFEQLTSRHWLLFLTNAMRNRNRE